MDYGHWIFSVWAMSIVWISVWVWVMHCITDYYHKSMACKYLVIVIVIVK